MYWGKKFFICFEPKTHGSMNATINFDEVGKGWIHFFSIGAMFLGIHHSCILSNEKLARSVPREEQGIYRRADENILTCFS